MVRVGSVLVAVAVAACTLDKPTSGGIAPRPGPRANAPWLLKYDPRATIARFAELRDARSIRCILAMEGYSTWEGIETDAPPEVIRVASFAVVERERRDGDAATGWALTNAVRTLAAVGDLDGLRQAFLAADALTEPPTFVREEAYRARVGLGHTIQPAWREPMLLELARETALAGDLAGAERILDREVAPAVIAESWNKADHVRVLVAMGRIPGARAVIAAATEDPQRLAEAWLEVAVRARRDVPVAVEALLAAQTRGRRAVWIVPVLRNARRAGLAAEVAPLRRDQITGMLAEHRGGLGSNPLYDEAIALGEEVERLALEPLVDEQTRKSTAALYDGPIESALALVPPGDARGLARVWVRHVAEGARPAIEARLAALACPPPDPTAGKPGVAAVPGVTLEVIEDHPSRLAPCDGSDVAVKMIGGGRMLGAKILHGECQGACTAAERRDGQRALDELRAEIAHGEATDSDIDYNFIECQFDGPREGRIDRVGARDVAILERQSIGAHDVEQQSFRLALELCGELYVSTTFAGTLGRSWSLRGLALAISADGREIRVDGNRDGWRGVLFRLTLPIACPGKPVEEHLDPGG